MTEFVICAPGPSLTAEDCDFVRQWKEGPGRRVMAVNLAWRLCPWADLMYAGDFGWWAHAPYREEAAAFQGEKWTASPAAAKNWGLKLLQRPILSNSGANAVLLASKLGAQVICLLGFDWGAGADGAIHFHVDHPHPLFNTARFEAPEIARLARELKHQGISVFNCSRRSALTCFERRSLESLGLKPDVVMLGSSPSGQARMPESEVTEGR